MNYKLSVIICNYNNDWCIERALNSIPKRNDIQVIIVDDGSTDNSDTIIRNYIQNNPIFSYKYIKNNANYGLGITRKIVQNFIEGEYFAILDCDDYFYTNEFNSILDNYLDKNYDIIFFNQKQTNNTIICLNENNYRNYSGHNKIIKTEFIINNNVQWHNLRKGSDLDFDRQWWYKEHNLFFVNILAKQWNRPNEQFSNLSLHGAKNNLEIFDKTREYMMSDNINVQIIKTIRNNRNNNEFLRTYNPTFEEVDYKYEVII